VEMGFGYHLRASSAPFDIQTFSEVIFKIFIYLTS